MLDLEIGVDRWDRVDPRKRPFEDHEPLWGVGAGGLRALALEVLVHAVPYIVGLADVELVLQPGAGRGSGQQVDTRPGVLIALTCSGVVAAGADQAQPSPVGFLNETESIGSPIGQIQPDG